MTSVLEQLLNSYDPALRYKAHRLAGDSPTSSHMLALQDEIDGFQDGQFAGGLGRRERPPHEPVRDRRSAGGAGRAGRTDARLKLRPVQDGRGRGRDIVRQQQRVDEGVEQEGQQRNQDDDDQ